jgi:hypothetical protein
MHGSVSSRLRLLGMVAVVVVLLLLPALAIAAPTEPVLGVQELQDKIDASPDGYLTGYLKTVMKGSKIETIEVDVLAITSLDTTGFANGPFPLILFEAKGAVIDRIGGIASGMSGSPIYVEDGGVDKLIGALSYGDSMTLRGTGLATPIEDMTTLETAYGSTLPMSLSRPVLSGRAGLIDRVTISAGSEAAHMIGLPGEIVMKPLATMAVGGVSPKNPGYLAFKKHLAERGVELLPLASPLGSGRPSFETTFEGGAAVAALAGRGDAWFGAAGTVTYATSDTVVAFGHPLFWTGRSGADLNNAWVTSVWPSSYSPYKIIEPGALRGTLTQDRSVGVLGRLDAIPSEATITAYAKDLESGRERTSAVYMPPWAINDMNNDWGFATFAAYLAGAEVTDAWAVPGSAIVTSTIVVSDGTNEYTVQRRNIFDDDFDIAYGVTWDASELIWAFQEVNTNGLAHANIRSVSVESQITSARKRATVVDVQTDKPLAWGDNKVTVSLIQHGVFDTQTVDVTLTIPANTSLDGHIEVGSESSGYEEAEDMFYEGEDYADFGGADRRSVADVVADLSDFTPNNILSVRYVPRPERGYEGKFDGELAEEPSDMLYDTVETSVTTQWYIAGGALKRTAPIYMEPMVAAIPYGGTAPIFGIVEGLSSPATLTITGQTAGETSESVLATERVYPDEGFFAEIPGLKKNTTLRAYFAGDDDFLPSVGTTKQLVRAAISFRSSAGAVRRGSYVTLSARLAPKDTTGQVAFQRWDGRRWVTIATKWVYEGAASARWKPPVGKPKVRAKFLGGPLNTQKTSGTVTLTVR